MRFELYKDGSGEWRWRLQAANGEIVASGESYKNEEDARHAIALVRKSGAAAIVLIG